MAGTARCTVTNDIKCFALKSTGECNCLRDVEEYNEQNSCPFYKTTSEFRQGIVKYGSGIITDSDF